MAHGQGGAEIAVDLSPTLTCNHEAPIVAYPARHDSSEDGGGRNVHYILRRMTPREMEASMGLPRDYTLIEYRGRPAADGHRYRAIGNSMAVPMMAWIGRRIEMVDRMLTKSTLPPSNAGEEIEVSAEVIQ